MKVAQGVLVLVLVFSVLYVGAALGSRTISCTVAKSVDAGEYDNSPDQPVKGKRSLLYANGKSNWTHDYGVAKHTIDGKDYIIVTHSDTVQIIPVTYALDINLRMLPAAENLKVDSKANHKEP